MRTKYERICTECGDSKTVTYKPQPGTKCKKCSTLESLKKIHKYNIKKEEDKKVYWYFCPRCPSVRKLSVKRKTALCGDCSRITTGIKNGGDSDMRHFRVCTECGDVKETSLSNSGWKLCRSCSNSKSSSARGNKKKKSYYKKPEPTVDGLQKVKLTPKKEKKVKNTPSDEELIAKWLETNEPSTKITKLDKMPHLTPSSSLCQGEIW